MVRQLIFFCPEIIFLLVYPFMYVKTTEAAAGILVGGIQFDRIVLLLGVEKMRTSKLLQPCLLCYFPTTVSKHLHEHEEFHFTRIHKFLACLT